MKIVIYNTENKHNVTLGSDPELFFESNTECVSAEGIVPGTKQNPYFITEEGHAIQLDNVAAEFNIPPVSSKEDWIKELNVPIKYLKDLAASNGLKISTKASELFNTKYLQTTNAKAFGCSPDYNVYTQDVNPSPNALDGRLRSAGGHVAIGLPKNLLDDGAVEYVEKIVKMFDMFVVLPALLLDKDERRRELYGKAGAFRFTPFGLEQRVLSNFWIHSEELMGWVFNQTMIAVNLVLDGNADPFIEKYSAKVCEIINSNDKVLAEELIKELGITLL